MTALLTALGSGMSAKKILEYLTRKSPDLAPRIAKALASGLTAEKVVKFFAKDKNFEKLKSSMEKEYPMEGNANPLVQGQNVRNKNLAPDMASSLQTGTGKALQGIAGLGAGMAMKHALPNLLKGSIPEKIEKIPKTSSQTPPLDIEPEAQQPPVNPTIAQTPEMQQPEVKNITSESDVLWDALGKGKKGHDKETDALLKIAKKMKTTGEISSKEDFDILHNLYQKKISEGKSVPAALREASNEFDKEKLGGKNPSMQSQEQTSVEPAVQKLDETQAIEGPKIEKQSIVASPQGVGEVREIRNGKALVEVDGKIHKVDVEDLEQEPESIRELDLEGPVSEYLARIPEGQKSSVIDVSLYDPTTQELQVRFPNGDQWVYGPIPEEIFEKINSMTGMPVSSGESKLRGTIWETGTANSAGADFYKLIKKFVKEGSVKERKLKTGIDLFKGFTRVKKRK